MPQIQKLHYLTDEQFNKLDERLTELAEFLQWREGCGFAMYNSASEPLGVRDGLNAILCKSGGSAEAYKAVIAKILFRK